MKDRRMALPLASYYVVTLGVPVANGAPLSGVFLQHALVVLTVPLVMLLAAWACRRVAAAATFHRVAVPRSHRRLARRWRTLPAGRGAAGVAPHVLEETGR